MSCLAPAAAAADPARGACFITGMLRASRCPAIVAAVCYGVTVGLVLPLSVCYWAEASAKELAELRETAQAAGVAAVFTEPGTSADVAEQIASEIGVPLIELPTIELPEDGSYTTFITLLAQTIVDGLLAA